MTYLEACRILGVDETTDEIEIKKRYRQLMKEAHPDTQAFIGKEETGEGSLRRTGYSAEEINAAYERLCQAEKKKKRTRNKKNTPVYHAPENQNAFCKRKIMHTAEGAGGENIGDFVVAEGKYLWIQEEDFKMFLKSLYLCGKELLDDIDDELLRTVPQSKRLPFQAELTYLLAGQFIDARGTLQQLTQTKADTVFLSAMLEKAEEQSYKNLEKVEMEVLQPGEILIPCGTKKHKLYLKDCDGKLAGYVSFLDDRLYYVVIPLLENRSVKVKIQVSQRQEEQGKTRFGRQTKFLYLDFWIKFPKEECRSAIESTSLKIEDLLRKYREG